MRKCGMKYVVTYNAKKSNASSKVHLFTINELRRKTVSGTFRNVFMERAYCTCEIINVKLYRSPLEQNLLSFPNMVVQIDQSINQSIDPSINQSINQSISQSIDCRSINQSINQTIDCRSINQSIDRSTADQSINQSINWLQIKWMIFACE